jgi:GNAT superfamily N-acetyltransferase
MKELTTRSLHKADRAWVTNLLKEWWAGPVIITRGKIHQADQLPGFVAIQKEKPIGLITYKIIGEQCEIISLNSLLEGKGAGSALINAVKKMAIKARCQRLWLITTNDNTAALRFWQKRGFKLSAVHRNAVEKSRQLKPEIPLTGNDGIPIRDEIELEMML